MLEFVFDEMPWERELSKCVPGENMSALRLLTLLEEADEDIAQEALDANFDALNAIFVGD